MLPRIYIGGEPYLATPYRAGTFIRADAFWRQLAIVCEGQIEYPEDDPVHGTWWTPHALTLGHHGLIELAMALATRCVIERIYNLKTETEALDFRAEVIRIRDSMGRLVLAGEPWANGIRWCKPVASDEEVCALARQIRRLTDEASCEASWDNHCTAQRLRLQARILAGRLVDPFWRHHSRKALQATPEGR